MVVEKLKEWEDKKDELEDQHILSDLNYDIHEEYSEMLMHQKLLESSKEKLAKLFHQYFLIKWEHHPLDSNN